LLARGDVSVNPVPRGLPTRRERQRPGQGVPLVRVPRTLPQVLEPGEVDALTAALRTHRDRAMVAAMVLGGLRRCEVLGLRLGDLRFGERRVFIAEGKGGHQRRSRSPRVLRQVHYLDAERPPGMQPERVTAPGPAVACRSRRRADEILDGPDRAGWRMRLPSAAAYLPDPAAQAGMTRGGAGPGRACLDQSTRIYLHLGDDWLASQYRRAAEAIDAQALAAHPAVASAR
jgi:hypothetical protein